MILRREALRTARLVLEPVDPSHTEAIWAATEASLPDLRRWMSWAGEATAETTAAFTAEAERDWELGRAYQFAILEDGAVIGALGLDTPTPIHRIGELGYWMRSDRTGNGFATEAAGALVVFGFDALDLYRIELRAGVDNRASQRVAEKLGFRREGRLHRGCPGGDGPYDCFLYGLLSTDRSGGG